MSIQTREVSQMHHRSVHGTASPMDISSFVEAHRGIVMSFPKGMTVISPDGSVLLANRAASLLIGDGPISWSFKDLSILDLMTQEPLSPMDMLSQALGGDNVEANCLMGSPWREGQAPVNLTLWRLSSPTGGPMGVMGIITDLSDLWEKQMKLAESERRHRELSTLLRSMCDNVPDMIWAKDLNKRYIFANRALAEKLLNARDTDEPIGKTDIFFAQRERDSHPEDPQWHTFGEICQDSDLLTIQAMAPSRFDEWGNVKGQFLFLDVHKAPFFDPNGVLIGTVGCGRDITREKAMEMELTESRKRLRLAMECGDIYAWDWDVDGGKMTLTPSPWGDGNGDEVSMGEDDMLFSRIHPDDQEAVRSKIAQILDGSRSVFDHVFRRRNRLGEWEWIWCKGAVTQWDPEARPIRVTGVARDVTDRMEATVRLERSEARYRGLFEGSLDGLLVLGWRSSVIVEANAEARRLLGKNDPIGHKVLLYPISGEAARPISPDELAQRPTASRVEVFASVPGGAPSPVEASAKWMELPGGERAILVTLRDLAPILKMKTQLLQSHKMRALSTLAEGMGHELNNILSPLQGYAEMGLYGNLHPILCFEKILEGVKRARELTMKLMMAAHPPKSTADLLDLREFLQRHLSILAESAPDGIELSWTLPDEPAWAVISMEHARQILLHLWSNAIWAVEDKGKVTVTLSLEEIDATQAAMDPSLSEGPYCVIQVTDDGCGMDETTRNRATEPFFSSRVPLGSGLGLSVVHGLVTHYRGSVIIDSKPNRGTTVRILLPLARGH